MTPEKIEFHAHESICTKCKGAVKMSRRDDGSLDPNCCWCIACGAIYYVDVGYDADAWENEQWKQKGELEKDLIHGLKAWDKECTLPGWSRE